MAPIPTSAVSFIGNPHRRQDFSTGSAGVPAGPDPSRLINLAYEKFMKAR